MAAKKNVQSTFEEVLCGHEFILNREVGLYEFRFLLIENGELGSHCWSFEFFVE
ncbi:hypothetical protein A2U01_0056397, partial [Trifolium medium]|nr:hypothetical protein [Trifolium medium]